MGNTVSEGACVVPVTASNWLGTAFQVTGVAAIQNSRVAAPAGAAVEAAAPVMMSTTDTVRLRLT